MPSMTAATMLMASQGRKYFSQYVCLPMRPSKENQT
jgi:hypothetical protein